MPPPTSPASSSSLDEGRFPAGTVLANRYRIFGLLGQGGMGEVYRANDLKLGQPVALKFLPPATGKDQHLLDRFHAEVRIARQVSHPNVCRVYDIGEVDGATFLSMEYVDGEDLRSLLRRIGRLPPDKALEIARKLCAGLAAAHDKGVLHRDLKPANVMIDGRGHVLITDFGLAALAGQLDGAQLRDGTPAYMAPEQLAGKEVSVRSDIYALGLVLHEMFTGKRAFENGSERTTPTAVTSHANDVDPLVERVILRCLDVEPHNRPASALAVAAALPGGDPLAAALAAGDTPTPAMVAASGDTRGNFGAHRRHLSGMDSRGIGGGGDAGRESQSAPADSLSLTHPRSWSRKRREMIQSFGYAAPPADRAYQFSFDTAYRSYAERQGKPAAYRDQLAKGQPPLIHFWYRQSPQPLVVSSPFTAVSPHDPPPLVSGMIGLSLDPQGRLLRLDAVPPQIEDNLSPPVPSDWKALFSAAGLDLTRFTPAESQWISPAAIRRASGMDRIIREQPGDSDAHRSRFLAREAGVLPVNRALVQTRTNTAVLGSPICRPGGIPCCPRTGCFSRLAQLPGETRRHPRSESCGGLRLRFGLAGQHAECPPCCRVERRVRIRSGCAQRSDTYGNHMGTLPGLRALS